MGFYSCSQIKIERDNDKDGQRIFRVHTYDVVLAKWSTKDFAHSDQGLRAATEYASKMLMNLDM